MNALNLECDYDSVIAMQGMEVGVREILSYSNAILSDDELRALLRGLEAVLERRPSADERDGAVEHALRAEQALGLR